MAIENDRAGTGSVISISQASTDICHSISYLMENGTFLFSAAWCDEVEDTLDDLECYVMLLQAQIDEGDGVHRGEA